MIKRLLDRVRNRSDPTFPLRFLLHDMEAGGWFIVLFVLYWAYVGVRRLFDI